MIRYKLCGRLDNKEILRYYQREKIDCFVHVSEMEGLPVSIMEAESAGIPIVAADVGGINEQIEENGMLIPADSSSDDVANALLKVLTASEDARKKMRAESRHIWERKFDAIKNARSYVESVCERFPVARNHVIIVTEGYPYYSNETPFLESELKEWLKVTDVTLIARIRGEIPDKKNEGCNGRLSVIPYKDEWNPMKALKYLFRYPFDKNTRIERAGILKGKKRHLIRYWESMKYYAGACRFSKWLMEERTAGKIDLDSALIYTYWNLQPTLGICFDRKGFCNTAKITRTHGYDCQDEQWTRSKRKPFAETVDKLLDSIVFVSRTGMERYIKDYHVTGKNGKYGYSYIGSVDSRYYLEDRNSIDTNDTVNDRTLSRIVSCSDLIPLKRVRLIIDALRCIQGSNPDMDVEWVHFGDGPLKAEIEEYAATQLGSNK